jgi:integrase/recombinase XerD
MSPKRDSQNDISRHSDGTFNVVLEHSTSTGSPFRVRYWRRGFKRKEKKFSIEKDAEDFASSVWTAYQRGVLDELPTKPPETLEKAASLFLQRTDIREKTVRSYSAGLKSFSESVGAQRKLKNIYHRDVSGWMETLKRTVRDTTRASYLRTVKAFFSWSIKRGWLETSPASEVRVSLPPQKVRFLPRSDWESFLDSCSPSHRIRAQFILSTGLRSGELLHARRENVYRSGGGLVLKVERDPKTGWEPKRGSFRELPLSGLAVDALEAATRTWRRGDYLFSNALITSWNGCRENRRACKKAELEYISIHGLRASFATYLLQLGIDILTISRLLGHTDHQVLARHYAGVSTEVLSSAIRRVNQAEGF